MAYIRKRRAKLTVEQRHEYQRTKMRELREARISAGLCPDGGGKKGPSTIACKYHANQDRQYARNRKLKVSGVAA